MKVRQKPEKLTEARRDAAIPRSSASCSECWSLNRDRSWSHEAWDGATIGTTGAAGEKVEAGRKAGEEGGGEDEGTGGEAESRGRTEGDGEPGLRKTDGATAPDIAMSPS